VILCGITLSLPSCTSFYLGRVICWGSPTNHDYQRFPTRSIAAAPEAFRFTRDPDAERRFLRELTPLHYSYKGKTMTADLETLLQETGTTAFIIIRDDYILFERYFGGYRRDSLNTSASLAKSFTATLVGVAVAEGLIFSIEDPILRYLPELEGRDVEGITIRQLLTMSSGLKHTWGMTPWHDVVRSYYSPDVRKMVLRVRVIEPPDRHYNYNNCHTQLLGIILERVTGMSASAYLESRIWIPLGMEYPASWCLDSDAGGFELMMSGLNARAIDFAKLGRLYLNRGSWQGRQILPPRWVGRCTSPVEATANIEDFYAGQEGAFAEFFDSEGYYSHHWWGYRKKPGRDDFFALGFLGQFIYVCPESQTIIIRMSERWGKIDWWPAVFRELAGSLR